MTVSMALCRHGTLASARLRPPVVVGLLATFVAVAAAAQSDESWWGSPAVGLGPLLLRPQSPFSVLRYSPTPLPPVVTPKGVWELRSVVNWNNYFAVDPGGRYLIDAESVGVTLGAAYGLTDRSDVRIALPVSYRGGGRLDSFIEDFEQALGVPNEVRERYPRDRYHVRIVAEDGTVFERTGADAGWGLEDLTLGLRYQLARGTESSPALLLFSGWKLPVGRESSLRSTGGTDAALGVAVGQRLGRFNLYGSLTAMHFSFSQFGGIELARRQWSLFAGVEFRKSRRTSWLLQSSVTSPAARDFADFSKRTYEITLGFKRLLAPDVVFEASVLENLFVFDNSPDVGFHLGLVWRSGRGRP